MIRIVIYLMKLVVAVLLSVFFSSCYINTGKSITGNGNVTTEKRNLADFKGISASNGLEVEIEQGSAFEVIVEADSNLHEHIQTEVKDGILIIETDINFNSVDAKKVYVKMPGISSIESSAGSSIKSKNTLVSENLAINSSSAGQVDVSVEAENLSCDSSSGSSIELHGKAIKLTLGSSSGSRIDAENLLANDVIASSSSGSSIEVHPIVSLNAEASSGSSIHYTTIPKNLVKSTSSGGSIGQK